MTLTSIECATCGPYELCANTEGTLRVREDDTLVLLAEETYLVKLSPEAAREAPALRVAPHASEGELRFGNFVGTAELGQRRLEVQSRRLDAKRVEQLLQDVSRHLASIPFRGGEPVRKGYERSALESPDVLYQAYVFVRHALMDDAPHDLTGAVHRILARPHEALRKEPPTGVPLGLADRADGEALLDLLGAPELLRRIPPEHPLASASATLALRGHLPETVLLRRYERSTDTQENRFVLHVLETLARLTRRVQSAAQTWRFPAARTVLRETSELTARLDRWRTHQTFTGVTASPRLPAHSTVMRGRPGYREVLRFWLDLQARTRLVPPEKARQLMEIRDMATIYELWCYFQVVKATEEVTAETAVFDQPTADHLSVSIREGSTAELGSIQVVYNRTYSATGQGQGRQPGRSYSVPLRPDIAIRTPAGTWHLFDAKLKRDVSKALRNLTIGDVPDEDSEAPSAVTFRRADLHKMHAYRDALGADSVWVLYPGGSEAAAEYSPSPLCDITATPAGVGAVPLVPGVEQTALKKLITRILQL